MSSSFPAGLDSLSNPSHSAGDQLNTLGKEHDNQHTKANDAIEAIQAKVGVDGSAVPTSLDYKVAQLQAGSEALSTQSDLQSALDAGFAMAHRGDITLTSTLFLRVDDCILLGRNTRFVWNGPAGGTPVQVERPFSYAAGFQVVPGSANFSVGLNLRNEVDPVHATQSLIERVRIGLYNDRRMDAGIRISGEVNGDSIDFRDVWISGANVAAVDVLNPQAINCGFDGLWMGYSARGMYLHGSDAGGPYGPGRFLAKRVNSHFMTTADFDIGPFAAVDVVGFNGEHSARLATIGNGSGLSLRHAYWQRGAEAVAASAGVVLGATGGVDNWLRLEDMSFTQGGAEQILNIYRRNWDHSPANENNVIGLAAYARPASTAVPTGTRWWDDTAKRWLYNSGSDWRDAVGTVVA